MSTSPGTPVQIGRVTPDLDTMELAYLPDDLRAFVDHVKQEAER